MCYDSFAIYSSVQEYLDFGWNNFRGELMIRAFKILCLMLAACIILALTGCSDLEPKTGTRVTFAFLSKQPLKRSKIAELSRYLVMKCDNVLNMRRARVETLTDDSLILLLPGKRVPSKEVNKLLQRSSIEFFHLKNVITKAHPERKWSIKMSVDDSGGYIFSGPDAQRIDSRTDKVDVLNEIVDYPKTKPIIVGKDIRPISTYQEIKNGWAILVHFTKNGTKKFYEFTKDHSGEYVGLFYNDSLMSVAAIDKPIKEGEVFLPGFKSTSDAETAVMQLNSGYLPVPVKIKSVEYY